MNFAAPTLILAAVLAQGQATATTPSAGDLAFRLGDFDAAYAAYASAAAAHPSDADAALGLGTIDLYRNDLADARTYLMKAAELDPSNPRVQKQLRILANRTPNTSDFQITMSGDRVDVPFLVTDPLPVLHATINGVQTTLFLDTNAGTIALSPDGAKKLNVTSEAAGQALFAGGKEAKVSAGRIDGVAFEGLTVRGINAQILPAPAKLAGYKIDGAIGDEFLQRFLSTIDYVHGRLTLRPRSASAAFESDALKNGATVVPMWLVGYQGIYCRARIGRSPEALFGIDTGGAGLGVQLLKAALDAAHIVPAESKGGTFRGGGGATRVLPFTAPSVSIGAFTVLNVPGLYFPDEDQYKGQFDVAGVLSHEYFRHSELSFDFDAMKLIVQVEK